MVNRAIVQGRLVADPELRHTQSGAAVASFRIACNRNYQSKDPNGQNADFINIVAWNKTAEIISQYFTKGRMILVDGRTQARDYTDNSGQKRYVTEIVAELVHFCGSKNESGSGFGQSKGNEAYNKPAAANNAYSKSQNGFQDLQEDDDDGELPF